jgi:hypothetical protein
MSAEVPTSASNPVETPTIPQDLQDQIQIVRALCTAFNLLDGMPVTRGQRAQQDMSAKYIHELYVKEVDKALAHPEYEKSEELVALKKVIMVNNGEAASLVGADKLEDARKKRAKKAQKLTVVKAKGKKSNGKK